MLPNTSSAVAINRRVVVLPALPVIATQWQRNFWRQAAAAAVSADCTLGTNKRAIPGHSQSFFSIITAAAPAFLAAFKYAWPSAFSPRNAKNIFPARSSRVSMATPVIGCVGCSSQVPPVAWANSCAVKKSLICFSPPRATPHAPPRDHQKVFLPCPQFDSPRAPCQRSTPRRRDAPWPQLA